MRKLFISLLFIGLATSANAQECDLPISIAFDSSTATIPPAVRRSLANRLKTALSENGVSGDYNYELFVLVPKFEVIDKRVVPGPPRQHVYNLTLYLEIRNTRDHQVLAMNAIDINSVGENDTKAYMGAVRQIAPRSEQMQELLTLGRQKIAAYYDENYQRFIEQARQLSAMNKTGEALYHLMSVPACCSGYQQVLESALQIYQDSVDRNGQMLLTKAKAVWAAGNNEQAAASAASLLAQIEPTSKAYAEAGVLLGDIQQKASAHAPWNYKLKVLNDAVSLEQQRIEAAKAVGVAFGQGQREANEVMLIK